MGSACGTLVSDFESRNSVKQRHSYSGPELSKTSIKNKVARSSAASYFKSQHNLSISPNIDLELSFSNLTVNNDASTVFNSDSPRSPGGESLISQKLFACCDIFVSIPHQRIKFIKYLKSGVWLEDLIAKPSPLLMELVGTKKIISPTSSAHFLSPATATNIMSSPSSITRFEQKERMPQFNDNCASLSFSKTNLHPDDPQSFVMKSVVDTCFSSEELKAVLVAALIPLFFNLKVTDLFAICDEGEEQCDGKEVDEEEAHSRATDRSVNYRSRRGARKQSESTASVAWSMPADDEEEEVYAHCEEQDDDEEEEGCVTPPSDQELLLQDVFTAAAESMVESELDALLESGSWLSSTLMAVERCPYSVSVFRIPSDGDKSTKGVAEEQLEALFTGEQPVSNAVCAMTSCLLIYANKTHEALTGQVRDKIVGRSTLLATAFSGSVPAMSGMNSKTETQGVKIAAIVQAFRQARAHQVVLSARRRDGEDFLNLLTLRPVFGLNGAYTHMIAVQHDASTHNSTIRRDTRQIEDLADILSSILK